MSWGWGPLKGYKNWDGDEGVAGRKGIEKHLPYKVLLIILQENQFFYLSGPPK